MIRNILVSAAVVIFPFLGIHPIFAQTGPLAEFEQLTQVLEGVYESSVAWGDYDGDGDLDILLTGIQQRGEIRTIYKNTAGTFTDVESALGGVYFSSVAWGDYDGDGDLDILLTGRDFSDQLISRIYRNNGGIFSSSFFNAGLLEGVSQSSVAWGDYDGDGDLDILLTGRNSSDQPISKIYRNNGNGADSFEDINAGLEGVFDSSVAWGDYDGDGDLDILLTGQSSSGAISRIYRNDAGTFTAIAEALAGVANSSVAWGDYDGDGDLDILLTGQSSSGSISKIYKNNGDGTFTDILADLEGVYNSSAAWGDYDGDGDLDILLTGQISNTEQISKIYRNDAGMFTDIKAGLEDVSRSSVAWGDYDGDGDLDILLTGFNNLLLDPSLPLARSRIYRNNSIENGQNYEAPTAPGNLTSSVDNVKKQVTLTWDAATDNTTNPKSLSYNVYLRVQGELGYITSPQALESDGWRLIPALGNGQLGTSYTWNYSNEDAEKTFEWRVQAIDNSFAGGLFSEANTFVTPTTDFKKLAQVLEGVFASSVAWGDYDGDGDLDILLTGFNSSRLPISKIYLNNGDETFTDINAALEGVFASSVAWGDYDGDGDLDILLTGFNSSNLPISKIYENNINVGGTFTDIINARLEGVRGSSVAWGDYDGDGDLDILLTGNSSSVAVTFAGISRIYRNDAGMFTDIEAGLIGVRQSSAIWGDYDGDGDLDILLAGNSSSVAGTFVGISRIYQNNGDETFTDINAVLEGVYSSSVAWGDYDGDGDLDIVLTGQSSSGLPISRIYQNGGDGTFTYINAQLEGVYLSSVAWGDYDGDGDLDILLTGRNFGGQSISKIYQNDVDVYGTFKDINAQLEGVQNSSAAWGDYDGDGDLDILLTGFNGLQRISSIYKNNSVETGQNYQAPTSPINLISSVDLDKKQVTLTWDAATDNTTNPNSLSYNVYLRVQGASGYITSPQSIELDGWRLIPGLGNSQLGTSYTWNYSDADAEKTVEWRVQAVDNSFAGGMFSEANTFQIKSITIDASASGTPVQVGSMAALSATVSSGVGGVSVIFVVTNEADDPIFISGPVQTNTSGIAEVSTAELNTIGVFKVTATAGSGSAESVAYFPVYDPSGNFVTGGGWIMSPYGAYKADESLTGKANFGFVSKYKKGSNQVDGTTEFEFKAGELYFKSTFHESGTLVISGKKATYRGEGIINGQPGYKFTLVALDGDYNGGTAPDQFRIKIWGGSGIIYDNGLGADDNADDATTLGGGSILIHEAKGNSNKRVVFDLVAVPWNTPSEEVEKKITSMSTTWFEGKAIKLNINTASYNPLAAGFYEMMVNVADNEWFALEEPITVNVLVAEKPLATDIQLSNSILLRNIHNGSVIGDLRTIDPVDDQHTYSIAENADFELVGHSLIWKGTAIPANARITVFSTDRAGQTIEKVIELSREPRFGDFIMFPNPAESDVTIEVELEQSMNVGVRIYDAIGRLVYQEEGVQNGIATYQIAIDQLSPGLYTVQVKTGILVMNKRLIKK